MLEEAEHPPEKFRAESDRTAGPAGRPGHPQNARGTSAAINRNAHPVSTDRRHHQPDSTRPATEPRLTPQQEMTLLTAYREGDPGALADLLRGYQRRIFAVCVRMLRNEEEARDLTQDTLLRLVERIDTYDGRAALSTWIIRIAMNLCFSHLRKRKLRNHASLDHATGGPDATAPALRLVDDREPGAETRVQQGESRRRLLNAMERLEPDMRAVLVLRDLQDLDYQQIADVLDLPIGTVKSRLFRAREALRTRLEESEKDDPQEARRDGTN